MFGSDSKVFLILGETNMRKAINGLSLIITCHELDVLSGNYFVFCNRARTIIKILYWERNGFCLWQKRLEKHRFCWPEQEEEVYTIDQRELRWLLEGLNPKNLKGHSNLFYKNIA